MAVSVKIDKPPEGGQNMCSGCAGHCCRLIVDLTAYDMFRLAILEGRLMADFAQLIYAEDDDAFAFMAEGRMVKFILKKKESGFCALLEEGTDLKCTVESSKPAICLAYPFSLQEGKAIVREDALCPPKNRLMADFAKMSIPVLVDSRWEWARYQEFVNDWNLSSKGNETAEKFLKFAAGEIELEKTPLGRFYRKIKRTILWKAKGL